MSLLLGTVIYTEGGVCGGTDKPGFKALTECGGIFRMSVKDNKEGVKEEILT